MIRKIATRPGRDLIATIAILPFLSLGLSCGGGPSSSDEGPRIHKGIRIVERSDAEKYQAFRGGGGPLCGADSAGLEVFCQPRSICISPETNACVESEKFYHAFRDGGGPLCGADSGEREVFCQPRTNCVDPEKNRCKGPR